MPTTITTNSLSLLNGLTHLFVSNFSNFSFQILFQINLRLILVSGKTKEFLFDGNDSALDIAHTVFNNWPEGLCSFLFISLS